MAHKDGPRLRQGKDEINFSNIVTNLYDSLSNQDENAHTYDDISVVRSANSSDTKLSDRKECPAANSSDPTQRSEVTVTLRMMVLAVTGSLLLSTLISITVGITVYHVTTAKMVDSDTQDLDRASTTALPNSVDTLILMFKQLEENVTSWNEEMSSLKHNISDLRQYSKVRELPWWADWSSWTNCYNNCTAGGRIQSRRRTVVKTGNQTTHTIEAETRPCNAVQFAGCIKSYSSTDKFGVTYDFADQLAQATCTAMAPGGYVNAVRRQCSESAPTCAVICSNVGRTCFNQLHVYRGSPVLLRGDVGKKGLQMYKYNSCAGKFCGPNFCCCKS